MELQYITHNNINFEKWDTALQNCSNKLIYAESIYLNTMCGKWNAIVNESYTYIMPIPVKSKFGVSYCPSIPFVQQLGIFSKEEITIDISNAFMQILKNKFKRIDYNFNFENFDDSKNKNANYLLDLRHNYEHIFAKYKTNLLRILNNKTEVKIIETIDINNALEFYFFANKNKSKSLNKKNCANFKKLCSIYQKKKRLIGLIAKSQDKLIASSIFLMDENRIYNLLPGNTLQGKKNNANHFILNTLIKKFAKSNYILDFEGSDIEGVANFYQQFGSINQPYHYFNFNNLPWYIKLIKKD
jgi:hypothetical protein